MTLSFAIKVLFEIGAVLLIAYGYKNEEKLIAFEKELAAVLKFVFKKYILKQVPNKTKQTKTVLPEQVQNRPAKKCATISNFPVSEIHQNVA